MAAYRNQLNATAPMAVGASLDIQEIFDGDVKVGKVGIPFRHGVLATESKNSSCFEILQIVDKSNLLVVGLDDQPIWLTIPTDELFDGK